MIDEKKIEEAAQVAADLYEQDLPVMSYNDDTEVDGQHHFCQEFGAELFKDGAKWEIEQFSKSLWHPASKEPEKFRKILYTGGSVDTTDTTMIITNNSWNTKVCLLEIKKWCYIDDLLLKEGCEQ